MRAGHSQASRPDLGPVRPRILVVHTGGIGDFLLCCPSIQCMARDAVLEKGEIDRTSSNRSVDVSRIAQANQGRAVLSDRQERGRDRAGERDEEKQPERQIPSRVVLTPPKDRDRGDRSR